MLLWPIAFVVVLGGPMAYLAVRRRRTHGIAGADATDGDIDHDK
jgi:hypothetical protein